MINVQVLLSTYNGEAYLRQQLASLFAQEGIAVQVLARAERFAATLKQVFGVFTNGLGIE